RGATTCYQSITPRHGSALPRWSQALFQDALEHYRQLLRLPGAPAAALAEAARLLLLSNLEKKEAKRDWPEVDRALTVAERLRPLPPAVVVLRAEYWAAQR